MSADSLSDALRSVADIPKPRKSDDEELEESLQKALDNTTPERAGCPWDGEEESTNRERGRGYIIREGN